MKRRRLELCDGSRGLFEGFVQFLKQLDAPVVQMTQSTLCHKQQHPGSDEGEVHDDGVVIVQLNGQPGMRVAEF